MSAPRLAPVIFFKYILKGEVYRHFDVLSLRGKNFIFSEDVKFKVSQYWGEVRDGPMKIIMPPKAFESFSSAVWRGLSSLVGDGY